MTNEAYISDFWQKSLAGNMASILEIVVEK